MIGGYIYDKLDSDIEIRLKNNINQNFNKITAWDNGYLFYNKPFDDDQDSYLVSDEIIVLSQDILVTADSGEYRNFNLRKEFPELFSRFNDEAFNVIKSDFRMVIVQRTKKSKSVTLVSNRAGSGRMFFYKMESGVLFASDLRFLLMIVKFDINHLGIYSILKYGAIPEPMTISNNISAVPPAHLLKYDLTSKTYNTRSYFKFKFDYPDDQNHHDFDHKILKPIKSTLLRSSIFLNKYEPNILLSGGIDSSLYGSYLSQTTGRRFQGFYCAFSEDDQELPFAKSIAERINVDFNDIIMKKHDAMSIFEDVTTLSDHPFSDFSSLPVAFLLKRIREHTTGSTVVIECNGGDDCFGFADLSNKRKFIFKHHFPKFLKHYISSLVKDFPNWKWESHEGVLARISALSDVHEMNLLNYFLVLSPINYLEIDIPRDWDIKLESAMEIVFANTGEEYSKLGYKAKMTIRQLLHVNSRRWAAKALSVGENLGLRIVYPYIWLDVLEEQGKLPWNAKIFNGIVKWPLKKLLEDFMPESFIYRKKSGFVPPFARWLTDKDFNYQVRDILLNSNGYILEIVPYPIIDQLLSDALDEKKLRHSILNFLWGAIFTEMWIQKIKGAN
jgi:asparagine synthase (glutamine-hydrolysing)